MAIDILAETLGFDPDTGRKIPQNTSAEISQDHSNPGESSQSLKWKDFDDAAERARLEEGKTLTEFRSEFEDMKMLKSNLTEIEAKAKAGLPLNSTELKLLYEVDFPVGTFQDIHERINELTRKRDPEADLLVMIDSNPKQVAHALDEVSDETKVYVGQLSPGFFKKLPLSITEIYTRPYLMAKRERIDVEIGGKTLMQLEEDFEKNGGVLDDDLKGFLHDPKSPHFPILEQPKNLNLVVMRAGDLVSDTSDCTFENLFLAAKKMGLKPVPSETALHIGATYNPKDYDVPNHNIENTLPLLASEDMIDKRGNFFLFRFSPSSPLQIEEYNENRPFEDPNSRFIFGIQDPNEEKTT